MSIDKEVDKIEEQMKSAFLQKKKEIDPAIQSLIESREKLLCVTGVSYSVALKIIKKLKENDIEANITVGGIEIYPTSENRQIIIDICKKFGTIPEPGIPDCQEMIILKGKGKL